MSSAVLLYSSFKLNDLDKKQDRYLDTYHPKVRGVLRYHKIAS